MAANDKIGFYLFGGDFNDTDHQNIKWHGKKLNGTKVADTPGLFSFDPTSLALTEGVQYKIIFTHSVKNSAAAQTYDTFLDTNCLGHIAYCNGTVYENPVDSSKKTLAAFWKDMDSSKYGPVLQISSMGNVLGTCPEVGKTPASIFVDFITVVSKDSGTTGLANARKYVVDVNTKTEQQLIDDIG